MPTTEGRERERKRERQLRERKGVEWKEGWAVEGQGKGRGKGWSRG